MGLKCERCGKGDFLGYETVVLCKPCASTGGSANTTTNTENDAISALREEVAELRKEVARHRSFVGMHTPLGGDSARF